MLEYADKYPLDDKGNRIEARNKLGRAASSSKSQMEIMVTSSKGQHRSEFEDGFSALVCEMLQS